MNNITRETIACLIFGLCVGVIVTVVTYFCATYNAKHPSKEDMTKIDSLIKVNDSIKIKIEKLDSIKDAKIIEVSTLDNDSTLKLFYKLVKE